MARRRLAPVDPARIAPAVDPSRGIDPSRQGALADAAALRPEASGDGPLMERGASVPRAEQGQGVPRAERSAFGPAAPIARVAADAAAGAALEEMAETLRAAREEGRFVLSLPLAEIAPDHLARDRIPVFDEDMTALRESIRTHGQRTPIEVMPLARGGETALPYALVSGWRRLTALKALHTETGDARFATVRALVLRPETAEAAYVAMVEENEIRVGLSYYERARVAARAVERGVFPDEGTALRSLFATASRPKRSRIGAFVELYRALDDALRFPQAIPERLGLRLVERLRDGRGPAIVQALAGAAPGSAEDELLLLDRLSQPAPERKPPSVKAGGAEIRPGVTLDVRRTGSGATLTVKGRGVTPELEVAIRDLLANG